MTQEDLNQLFSDYYNNSSDTGTWGYDKQAYEAGFKKALELVLEKCHVRDGNTLLTCLDMEDILDSL